jgi:hypothetical protein
MNFRSTPATGLGHGIPVIRFGGTIMRKKLFGLVTALALTTAVAAMVASKQERVKQPLPPALSNLAAVNVIEVRNTAGQVVLGGTFSTGTESKGEVEHTATFTGSGTNPAAKGKAEIELVQKGDAVAKQELEVEVEGLPPSASYMIFVDGNEAATFTTGKGGKAELKFSSKYTK